MSRILRLPEVRKLTGLSRSSIYAKVGEGSFPRHITISKRSVGWIESEVANWIASRIQASRKGVSDAAL